MPRISEESWETYGVKDDGAVIEYQVQGNGEPVLLIPPGVTIDGLGLPLLAQPQLASRFQLIHYHRHRYTTHWRGARVVEWDGLENRCGPMDHRGFEYHPLRLRYKFQSY